VIEIHNENCDEHRLDFPHHVVTTKKGNLTFITCALCGHNIAMTKAHCMCKASCHTSARMGDLTDVIGSEQNRSEGPNGDDDSEAHNGRSDHESPDPYQGPGSAR
jgi:hypothetical protein